MVVARAESRADEAKEAAKKAAARAEAAQKATKLKAEEAKAQAARKAKAEEDAKAKQETEAKAKAAAKAKTEAEAKGKAARKQVDGKASNVMLSVRRRAPQHDCSPRQLQGQQGFWHNRSTMSSAWSTSNLRRLLSGSRRYAPPYTPRTIHHILNLPSQFHKRAKHTDKCGNTFELTGSIRLPVACR